MSGHGETPEELRYWLLVERAGGWLNYIAMPPRQIEDLTIIINAENMARSAGAFFAQR